MAFEELKQEFTSTGSDMRSYLENSEEYLKLKVFKLVMKLIATMARSVLIGAFVLLGLMMLSFGLSLALNKALDSYYFGFIITGVFFVLIAVICYFLRDRLNRPLLRKFSEYYFD